MENNSKFELGNYSTPTPPDEPITRISTNQAIDLMGKWVIVTHRYIRITGLDEEEPHHDIQPFDLTEQQQKDIDDYDERRKEHHRDRYWKAVPINGDSPTLSYAMVIGTRYLYNGKYCPGGGFYEEYEPACLEIKECIQCLLVVMGYRSNPIRIPLNGYKLP